MVYPRTEKKHRPPRRSSPSALGSRICLKDSPPDLRAVLGTPRGSGSRNSPGAPREAREAGTAVWGWGVGAAGFQVSLPPRGLIPKPGRAAQSEGRDLTAVTPRRGFRVPG